MDLRVMELHTFEFKDIKLLIGVDEGTIKMILIHKPDIHVDYANLESCREGCLAIIRNGSIRVIGKGFSRRTNNSVAKAFDTLSDFGSKFEFLAWATLKPGYLVLKTVEVCRGIRCIDVIVPYVNTGKSFLKNPEFALLMSALIAVCDIDDDPMPYQVLWYLTKIMNILAFDFHFAQSARRNRKLRKMLKTINVSIVKVLKLML